MKFNALVGMTAAVLISTVAAAGNAAHHDPIRHAASNDARKGAFAALDADADGVVTRAEAQANSALVEKFDLYDANHDGVLSRREYDAATAGSGKVGTS